jgi:hypothetical protein
MKRFASELFWRHTYGVCYPSAVTGELCSLMRASKVKIENPIPGESEYTSLNRARRFVGSGRAVFTGAQAIRFVVESRRAEIVRLVAKATEDRVHRAVTGVGYDRVDRCLGEKELRHVPVVNGVKMIRQERSERNWSYASAVWRGSAVPHGRGRGGSNPSPVGRP